LNIVMTFQLAVAIVISLFVSYNVFHYVLFLLVTQPKDASKIGHELNQFEQRQLIEWTPQPIDFLKHDDEKRTYDDVFGAYRDEQANYITCVFPRVAFSHLYDFAPTSSVRDNRRHRSNPSPWLERGSPDNHYENPSRWS
jgi:hypothetical protein